jgi:hypothetical protein
MASARPSPKNRVIAGALVGLAVAVLGAMALSARNDRSSLSIRLRWVRSYDSETWNNVQTGVLWSLSFLGARLDHPLQDIIVRQGVGASTFELRLDQAGFASGARPSLVALLDQMKKTEEYRREAAFDLGRFVALTLGGSWNYYAITQAHKRIEEFRAAHDLDSGEIFPVLNSDVAKHSRLLHFVVAPELDRLAFMADELSGTYGTQNVRALGHEVMDVMPNGQLRFAVYDEQGRLTEGTPPEQSGAGKPAKCLWCHEINIFSLFRDTPDLPRHMSAASFSATMAHAREVLARERDRMHALVDFRRTQDHTQAELLYIAFMEPSAERLSVEWGIPLAEVKNRMAGRSTHVYAEFPFLGTLYDRRSADAVTGRHSLPPPDSVREPGAHDVDYLGYALR